jgi:hypothetical protein
VIARVTKERDDALALVQGAESRFRSSAAAGASSSAMEVDGGAAYPGISMDIKTKISEIGVELLQQVRVCARACALVRDASAAQKEGRARGFGCP